MKMTTFSDVTPCSLVELGRRFRGMYFLHHQGALIVESVRNSETSVYFYETTLRHIPYILQITRPNRWIADLWIIQQLH
jgi:hypothetical protein